MAKVYDYSKLPAEERWIIDQTLQTGNVNYFTNFYFRLPNSGTMWMPDDSLGNYRNVFQYEQLHDARASNGKPETFTITADGNTLCWTGCCRSLTSTHGSRWPRREQAQASAFQPMP